MSTSICSYINRYYTIAFQSNSVTEVDKADIYLLPEIHDSQEQKDINAELIDKFDSTSLVFVEEFPSMKEINQIHHIQTYMLKNTKKVLGWDAGTLSQFLELDEETTKKYENFKLKKIEWHKKAKELTNTPTSETELYDSLSQEASSLKQEVTTLASELSIREKLDIEKIKDTFQLRNNTLISTLEKTDGHTRLVIGGEFHFIEDEETKDSRTTVQPLRDYLAGKKAVILAHKTSPSNCCIQ